jgi:HEAT repeat protein
VSAIPWLAEHLHDTNPDVRRGVVDALGRLAHPAASAFLQGALDDGEAGVRVRAIATLSRLGTRGMTRRFAELARTDPADEVRKAAAAALQRRTLEDGGAEGE